MKNLEILWESVTGVRTEEPAPFLRILSFIILLIGIIWAVFNCYKIVKMSDLHQESYSEKINTFSRQNNNEIIKLANNVRALISMRHGGQILAASINNMNRRLFNDDANYLSSSENSPETEQDISKELRVTVKAVLISNRERIAVTVKAVLISNRERIAVIDLQGAKGVIIRQGGKIPAINARVLKIDKDGVILSVNGKNFLASFNETAKTDEKSNSPASTNIK